MRQEDDRQVHAAPVQFGQKLGSGHLRGAPGHSDDDVGIDAGTKRIEQHVAIGKALNGKSTFQQFFGKTPAVGPMAVD